jgi:glycosyltransferase involved in cell wall biosynthesis
VRMRVALAHDYLTQHGGAERVALVMARAFPGSTLYTSVYDSGSTFAGFSQVRIVTSVLQRVDAFRRDPRLALPLLPAAWERLRVDDADAVVCSSTGWAHAISTGAGCRKIVYCHNPARWLYQPDEYFTSHAVRSGFEAVRRRLAKWDKKHARAASLYIANSSVVAGRIREAYGLEPVVLHPPVAIDVDGPREAVPGLAPGFWLTVARGRGYKNTPVLEEAVRRLGDAPLAVVGADETDSREGAVRRLGVVTDAQLRWLYANARALVSISFEDFGLTPIEANAFGTPVAVLKAGGFVDSTVEGRSGSFIAEPTADAVYATLKEFPDFDPDVVRANAERFGVQRFQEELNRLVRSVDGAPL